MDFGRRNTKKYTFRTPELQKLRELGSLILDPEGFRERYGNLLTILNTSVEKGILETLVQFYDPLYHCFIFPDYQLLPTLEEYSYLMDLPVLNKVPFTGLEKIPESPVIVKALHLETSVVKANFTERKIPNGTIKGLESRFLLKKAHYYA